MRKHQTSKRRKMRKQSRNIRRHRDRQTSGQTDDLVSKFRQECLVMSGVSAKSCRIPILAHLALLISHLSTFLLISHNQSRKSLQFAGAVHSCLWNARKWTQSRCLEISSILIFKYLNIQASTSCQLPHVSKCFKCPNTFYFYFSR